MLEGEREGWESVRERASSSRLHKSVSITFYAVLIDGHTRAHRAPSSTIDNLTYHLPHPKEYVSQEDEDAGYL